MSAASGHSETGPGRMDVDPQSSASASSLILTQNEILQIFQIIDKLKAAGVAPSDPRFTVLIDLLRAQGWRGTFGLGSTSGISAAGNAPSSAKPTLNVASLQSDSQQGTAGDSLALLQMNEEFLKTAPAVHSFSATFQLKAQILAFRFLARNLPLPPNLLAAIRGMSPLFQKPLPLASKAMNGTASSRSSSTAAAAASTPLPQPVLPPNPVRLDPRFLLAERERRIHARVAYRLQELEQLLPTLSGQAHDSAMLELRQLRLLSLQRKMRRELASEMRKVATLEAAGDPAAFKRPRRLLREARPNDRSEKQRQADQEVRRKQKHKEFLGAVLAHAKDFKDYHYENRLRVKKLNRSLLTHHQNLEKRAAARRERAEKERLRALKADDFDGYLKMLEQTKNERLKLLLKQTDEYLDKIGAMVQMEKDRTEEEERAEAAAAAAAAADGEGAGPTDGTATPATAAKAEADQRESALRTKPLGARAREAYYKIAHTVIEEVKEQPEMLVGGRLKEYQLAGLQWLVSLYNNNLNGILADEMGLGKTIQTISLVCYLMEKKKVHGPYMIVVPLSTLANWSNEFERWAPSVKKVIYKGLPRARKAIYENHIASGKFSVLLTTYEYIMKDKNMLSKVKWNYIIIDEGHRMKNHSCKLSTIFSQYYTSRHRVLLTGTPLQNSLPELWSLLNFLLPTIFNSVDNFENWFNAPFAIAGEKVEMTEEENLLIINRLHQVLRPFLLRRLKSEVESQLPDKVEKVLKCELSAWQRRMYRTMFESGVLMLKDSTTGGKPGVKGLMNTLMQLRKICNHPYLFERDFAHDEQLVRTSGKFALLDRMLPKLKAAGHRVLLFSQMTQCMSIMEDYFVYRGFKYLRLDGSTKADDRGELLERFNSADSPYFIFMLSTRAGGLGLNLQAADTVILFDSDWNPQMDLQAQDRAHRIGQTQEVRVFRLVSINSIEEKILARATFKLNMDAKIIQAGKFNNTSSQEERRAMLESLLSKDHGAEQEGDEFGSLSQEEQDAVINSMLARNERELRLYEEYDRQRELQDLEEARLRGLEKAPPRLVQDSELPEWMRSTDVASRHIFDQGAYGRGKRDRGDVAYDDHMTEQQFIEYVEEGKEVARPKRRADGTLDLPPTGTLEDNGQLDDDDDDDDAPRRKRVRSEPVGLTSPSAGEGPSRGRRKKDVAPPLRALANKLEKVWSLVERHTDDTGRKLSTIFMKLPSRKELPNYYEVIERPIDMQRIQKKIQRFDYYDAEACRQDFLLMFANAQRYNDPTSQIFTDAGALQVVFREQLDKVMHEPDDPPASAPPAPAPAANASPAGAPTGPTIVATSATSFKIRAPIAVVAAAAAASEDPTRKRGRPRKSDAPGVEDE